MNYLLSITHIPSPENELQQEVFEYISHGDRLPVNREALDRLMNAMTYHIKPTGDIDLMLFIDGQLSTLSGSFLKVADL